MAFEQRFLKHLEAFAPDQVWSALDAALDALGEALEPRIARQLVGSLPARLHGALLRGKGPQDLSAADVYRHVSRHLGVSEGRAVELTQTVLEGLASVLEPAVVGRFKRALGAPLDDLVEARPPAFPPADVSTTHSPGHSLAEGRGGASRPLSEAHPDANTHQTQEREDETLATRKPSR